MAGTMQFVNLATKRHFDWIKYTDEIVTESSIRKATWVGYASL